MISVKIQQLWHNHVIWWMTASSSYDNWLPASYLWSEWEPVEQRGGSGGWTPPPCPVALARPYPLPAYIARLTDPVVGVLDCNVWVRGLRHVGCRKMFLWGFILDIAVFNICRLVSSVSEALDCQWGWILNNALSLF